MVLLIKCSLVYQIKEGEKNKACGINRKKRYAHSTLVGKPQKRNHSEGLGTYGRIILQLILKRNRWEVWTRFT